MFFKTPQTHHKPSQFISRLPKLNKKQAKSKIILLLTRLQRNVKSNTRKCRLAGHNIVELYKSLI